MSVLFRIIGIRSFSALRGNDFAVNRQTDVSCAFMVDSRVRLDRAKKIFGCFRKLPVGTCHRHTLFSPCQSAQPAIADHPSGTSRDSHGWYGTSGGGPLRCDTFSAIVDRRLCHRSRGHTIRRSRTGFQRWLAQRTTARIDPMLALHPRACRGAVVRQHGRFPC